jgi:hypothetical protein
MCHAKIGRGSRHPSLRAGARPPPVRQGARRPPACAADSGRGVAGRARQAHRPGLPERQPARKREARGDRPHGQRLCPSARSRTRPHRPPAARAGIAGLPPACHRPHDPRSSATLRKVFVRCRVAPRIAAPPSWSAPALGVSFVRPRASWIRAPLKRAGSILTAAPCQAHRRMGTRGRSLPLNGPGRIGCMRSVLPVADGGRLIL